ncbi:MAG: sigma-70 family RNA polymerase sigma factor [Bacteroidales bacterium]|nr:sigma-70 family RNA polymerase sigma factor [Bacteroidales bacterium]
MRTTENELIKRCLDNDSTAFKELYDEYAPKMFGVCLRYAKNEMEAEDILQDGFIKIFSNLHRFKFEGSFEGWLRRTFVNTAINHYKKNLRHAREMDIEEIEAENLRDEKILDRISADEILAIVQSLPDGYKVVFNLNVLEGYTHKMIGQMLNISENTSKSQLLRAKRLLREKITRHASR